MTARRAKGAGRRARPWMDYGLRILASALLFGTGYELLVTSTFAVRLRTDFPATVGTAHGAEAVALGLALVLAFAPLLFGKRYLGALLVSSFLLSGIGGYWWSSVPWDDLVTTSGFGAGRPPAFLDYPLIASPVLVVVTYVALSRASRLHADLRSRGVDAPEARVASAAAFLSGASALVLSVALALVLWAGLASGWLLAAHGLVGVPAVLAAGVLVAAGWIANALLKRPSRDAAGREDQARSPERRSPS